MKISDLTLEQIMAELERRAYTTCQRCKGAGYWPGEEKVCGKCKGSGKTPSGSRPCKICDGAGKYVVDVVCPRCEGTGLQHDGWLLRAAEELRAKMAGRMAEHEFS